MKKKRKLTDEQISLLLSEAADDNIGYFKEFEMYPGNVCSACIYDILHHTHRGKNACYFDEAFEWCALGMRAATVEEVLEELSKTL